MGQREPVNKESEKIEKGEGEEDEEEEEVEEEDYDEWDARASSPKGRDKWIFIKLRSSAAYQSIRLAQ